MLLNCGDGDDERGRPCPVGRVYTSVRTTLEYRFKYNYDHEGDDEWNYECFNHALSILLVVKICKSNIGGKKFLTYELYTVILF